jgi:endo-1,4-beta-D-glucanase Y
MKRLRFYLILPVFALVSWAFQLEAALLPFPITLPAVSQSYDSILLKTWQGIKKRNIDPYSIPLVHRPKSEKPDDAVSEGVGYGLFCALYCNDQPYFNKIWDAAEQYMWAGNSYNWRVDKSGGVIGTGPASDAEEDIACALIFADLLVKRNVWQQHTSPKGATYAVRAQSVIDDIWNVMVESGKYLRPGSNWGGAAFVNPGYFAPAFYRIFGEFGGAKYDWAGVIDQCYRSAALSPGFKNGLVPDWMKPDGSWADTTSLGYNAYGGGKYCYKDAIRILWRFATDYLWYSEPRAKAFLDKSFAFIKTPDRANFYQMDGSAIPESFQLGNGVTRPRTEHSHLTMGMWATAAMASGTMAAADSFSSALLDFYTPGADFFGKAFDPAGEDTLHNEMYFDQFLAWFGASLISGVFTDLWEDLKDPNPNLPLQWKSAPTFSGNDIDANVNPLKIFGTFNKSARWTAAFKEQIGDSAVQYTGMGETLSVVWYGLSSGSRPMPAGWYTITITAKGLADPVNQSFWLGRARDLKINNRLLVDDFRDKDLVPYFGAAWRNYLDSYEGRSGKSTVPVFAVQGNDTAVFLRWSYLLNGSGSLGYDPFAALEWNCEPASGTLTLTGLDTVIVVAKALSSLPLSVQLITGDITDYNYFQDSVTFTQQWQEYRLPIKSFKHRFAGNTNALDLTKLIAIRFQIQNKDGSTNEINVKRMLFAGNLASLYQSPPPYVQRVIPIRYESRPLSQDAIRVVVMGNGRVYLHLGKQFRSATMVILDCKGKEVRTLKDTADMAVWDGFDNGNCRVKSGMYVAVVSGPGGTSRVKIPLVNR